jgi:hypothetical protein
MTWKGTAAVSGVGLLATWLASNPPLQQPAGRAELVSGEAQRTAAASAEIQHQAARLRERLQTVGAYPQPARNPFRFNNRPRPPAARQVPAIAEEPVDPLEASVQPTLRITLSGIAEEKVDDRIVRTAIISTPHDVFLVKEGDAIEDTYKVVTIASDAVELTRVIDGGTVRLALKP